MIDEDVPELPDGGRGAEFARGALEVASGAIPFAGGLLAAVASAWSEREQGRINKLLHEWIRMIHAEMKEKERTILEIMARVDMRDEKTAERVESEEYQSLLRKSFREWAGAESEEKRVLIRNLLANAATASLTNDDVVRLFLEWIKRYAELHFAIIATIYNNNGVTRRDVWERLGRDQVREDSADADLFKLIFRDFSTDGIIRRHRETDYAGNYLAKARPKAQPKRSGVPQTKVMKSAFDDGEQYELTALGQQFVHYTMTDLPPKIEYEVREPESNSPPGDGHGTAS
jgi:hypothetical protein